MNRKFALAAVVATALFCLPTKADQRLGVTASEVLTSVRNAGYQPSGKPVHNGEFYVLRAVDPGGQSVRVVVDAQYGDIVSVSGGGSAAGLPYRGGPRIIHVPQGNQKDIPRRANARAIDAPVDEDDATADDDEDLTPSPSPKPRRVIEPPRRRSDAPPPPPPKGPKRAVLSAPPPAAESLSPVKPTPRWRNEDKFAAPKDPIENPADEVKTPPAVNNTDTQLPIGTEQIPGETPEDTPPAQSD